MGRVSIGLVGVRRGDMNERMAHLLVRIETMTATDRHATDDVAARLAAQTTRRLSWWKRRASRFLAPLPRSTSPAT